MKATNVWYRAEFKLTKDTQYLALMGELCSVFLSILERNDRIVNMLHYNKYHALIGHWNGPLTYIIQSSSLHIRHITMSHYGRDGVSNQQPHYCLLTRLFRRRSNKTTKLRVNGLFVRNSPVAGEFTAQMAGHVESVFIWWRHHATNALFAHNHKSHNPLSPILK